MTVEDCGSLTFPMETVLRGEQEELNCEKLMPLLVSEGARGAGHRAPPPPLYCLGRQGAGGGRALRELFSSRACLPLAGGTGLWRNGKGMDCGDLLGISSWVCYFGRDILSFPEWTRKIESLKTPC